MRVAIATSFPGDPDRPRGGVEAVSVNLVRALARLDDLEIHVVTTDAACDRVERSAWEGATVHRLPWVGRRVLVHATGPGRRDVCAYLAGLAPDVVHAHDIYGIMVRGLAIPRVFTIHGFIHADTLEAGARFARLRSRIWARVERSCWADQPHIVSISPYVRERLRGIATGIIHDIDNPIAAPFFDVPREEREGTIFSAALICPRKNQLTLIDALARLVRGGVAARLRLAGSVSDAAYGRRVEERIRASGLDSRVDLLGGVRADQVRQELSRASVFVLPSFEEGSPMGIEEAMAAGVPVVSSNRCGMPYLIRDGESGFLIDPHDPADIAERIGQILADPVLRADMSRTSRDIARGRFHPDAVARRTRDVYVRAVRQSR